MSILSKAVFCSLIVIALAMTVHPAAYCWQYALSIEMHFAIHGDYVYTPTRAEIGSFKKIEKTSGRLIWASRRQGSASILNCTSAVFFEHSFYTIETYGYGHLYSINCETGVETVERKFDFGCGLPTMVYDPLVANDLLLAFGSNDVKAYDLKNKKVVWEVSYCKNDDSLAVLDRFREGDRLYLLAVSNASPVKLLELDISTGNMLHRLDKNAFFGNSDISLKWVYDYLPPIAHIGEWNGRRLILVTYETGAKFPHYRLFAFDPHSKSVETVLEQVEDVPDDRKGQKVVVSPMVSGDTLYYRLYAEPERSLLFPKPEKTMLVAKSLVNGNTLWSKEVDEVPYAVDGEKLLTVSRCQGGFEVFCRDVSMGELLWSKKLTALSGHANMYEIQVSDNRIFILSTDFLHSLNADNGEEIWHVQLRPDEGYEHEPEESIWSGFWHYFGK